MSSTGPQRALLHTETLPDETAGQERLCLVGLVDGHSLVRLLPTRGHVTIGRAGEVDVNVAHPSISRVHAALHLGTSDAPHERACHVEDLGSRNGTRVKGISLAHGARVPLAVGEGLELGSIPFLLQVRRGEIDAEDDLPPSRARASTFIRRSTSFVEPSLRDQVSDLERDRILSALERCAGNQTRAAMMLGMPRATFVKRLDAFGIARPRKR